MSYEAVTIHGTYTRMKRFFIGRRRSGGMGFEDERKDHDAHAFKDSTMEMVFGTGSLTDAWMEQQHCLASHRSLHKTISVMPQLVVLHLFLSIHGGGPSKRHVHEAVLSAAGVFRQAMFW